NNVLCFPYLFRGSLDVGATSVTPAMEKAAVYAIDGLAREEQSERVLAAYGSSEASFGPDYLIPKPFDPRLIMRVAPAVAKAAMETGVASRPITDLAGYTEDLKQFVYHSGAFMKPLFSAANTLVQEGGKARIVFAEGEDERVLRAVQVIVDENLAQPILVGRPDVIATRIKRHGLRFDLDEDVEITNPEQDERFHRYWTEYWQLRSRKGITRDMARTEMRRRMTLIGAMMMHLGEADGMICGTVGSFFEHLRYVDEVIGLRQDAQSYAAMNVLLLAARTVAVVDTHINEAPTAEQIAEYTIAAAEQMQRLNLEPRIALLSHSNFGSSNNASARKMRTALALIQQHAPHLEVDGEMHGDCALDQDTRRQILPDNLLAGSANLRVCPDPDSGNIPYTLLKTSPGS